MDINPANDGHSLVIAKEHVATLFEISDESFAAVARSARKLARAVDLALTPDGLNLIQANGKGAQQSVAHFHIHVLPRKLGDALKLNWTMRPGNRDAIAAIAEKIRGRL